MTTAWRICIRHTRPCVAQNHMTAPQTAGRGDGCRSSVLYCSERRGRRSRT
ncbi:hypothetical protein HSR6_0195 [Halodesulfurarchaeum formicicum]|uniref:Uncharacterized protein n=1 Tax=Halodesulfurarchaeum formicicum TaxID=1873524 RepID=A0A1J1AA45_9EURY|nr:hypothetical protein HSR6_0195 [Halodesulfurarchaeum formicicum]